MHTKHHISEKKRDNANLRYPPTCRYSVFIVCCLFRRIEPESSLLLSHVFIGLTWLTKFRGFASLLLPGLLIAGSFFSNTRVECEVVKSICKSGEANVSWGTQWKSDEHNTHNSRKNTSNNRKAKDAPTIATSSMSTLSMELTQNST